MVAAAVLPDCCCLSLDLFFDELEPAASAWPGVEVDEFGARIFLAIEQPILNMINTTLVINAQVSDFVLTGILRFFSVCVCVFVLMVAR